MQNPDENKVNTSGSQNDQMPLTSPAQQLGSEVKTDVANVAQAGANKVTQIIGQITNLSQDLRKPEVGKDEKVYGAIAYIPFVALISIIIKPDSAYVRLHAKQGLLLSALFILGGIFAAIVSMFGVLGIVFASIIGLLMIAFIVVGVYSLYLAASGYWWKIPVLSAVSDLIPVEAMAKVSKENITGQIGVAKNDFDNRQDTLQKEASQSAPQQPVIQPGTQVTGTTIVTNNSAAGTTPTEGQQLK